MNKEGELKIKFVESKCKKKKEHYFRNGKCIYCGIKQKIK